MNHESIIKNSITKPADLGRIKSNLHPTLGFYKSLSTRNVIFIIAKYHLFIWLSFTK